MNQDEKERLTELVALVTMGLEGGDPSMVSEGLNCIISEFGLDAEEVEVEGDDTASVEGDEPVLEGDDPNEPGYQGDR